MDFLKVTSLEEALRRTAEELAFLSASSQVVPLADAVGRILSADVCASEPMPPFHRATVDGFAIDSRSVFGASESAPAFLRVVGEVEMGVASDLTVGLGEAVYVPTGGQLVPGADAMLMVEYAESLDRENVAAYHAVAPKDGVMAKGEDYHQGEMLLQAGTRLDARNIGLLASLGQNTARVCQRPRVSIFSTGNELVEPPTPLDKGQIWDVNRFAASALLEGAGAEIVRTGLIPDEADELTAAFREAMKDSDFVVISGGSSVGLKDMSAKIIHSLGQPGVFIHGIAVKPGKPTIVGRCEQTMFFGLPGHPAAAFLVVMELVLPTIKAFLGENKRDKFPVFARLTQNLPAGAGRRTYQTVTLTRDGTDYLATPLFGKSGAMSWLSRADGYVVVEQGTEGLPEGNLVPVYFFGD